MGTIKECMVKRSAMVSPGAALFSDFFRARDKAEVFLHDYEKNIDGRYKKVRDTWQKQAARKEKKRAQKLQIEAMRTKSEPQDSKLVVHNDDAEITYPQADDGMFAVTQIAGSQHKVMKDDVVLSEKLADAKVGDQLVFDKVLLVGTRDYTAVGRPYVGTAKVYATVEEQTLSNRIIVFKKKRRKNYKRTRGHRQDLTVLRIDKVVHEILPQELTRAVGFNATDATMS
jgi:large subunit ribosomal protein L21